MIITIRFSHINVSCQVGDIAYGSRHLGRRSGKNQPASAQNTKPLVIGVITGIDRNIGLNTPVVTIDTNASGGIGNNSSFLTLPAEMFATAVDYIESSK